MVVIAISTSHTVLQADHNYGVSSNNADPHTRPHRLTTMVWRTATPIVNYRMIWLTALG